jgi:SOS-response transcriptional repressor LexA
MGHAEIVRHLSGRDVTTSSRVRARSLTQITVVGRVQAGAWHPTLELDEQASVPYVAPAAFRRYHLVAFAVAGHSMDRVYPDGSSLIAVSYEELGRDPRPGERVIVQRYKHDEVEATCKELRVGPQGALELWPLSTRPEFQSAIPVEPAAGERVHITHRVVAAIVHEPL